MEKTTDNEVTTADVRRDNAAGPLTEAKGEKFPPSTRVLKGSAKGQRAEIWIDAGTINITSKRVDDKTRETSEITLKIHEDGTVDRLHVRKARDGSHYNHEPDSLNIENAYEIFRQLHDRLSSKRRLDDASVHEIVAKAEEVVVLGKYRVPETALAETDASKEVQHAGPHSERAATKPRDFGIA